MKISYYPEETDYPTQVGDASGNPRLSIGCVHNDYGMPEQIRILVSGGQRAFRRRADGRLKLRRSWWVSVLMSGRQSSPVYKIALGIWGTTAASIMAGSDQE